MALILGGNNHKKGGAEIIIVLKTFKGTQA
jgi:hypothetical protein